MSESEARRKANGEWLEELVYNSLSEAGSGVFSAAAQQGGQYISGRSPAPDSLEGLYGYSRQLQQAMWMYGDASSREIYEATGVELDGDGNILNMEELQSAPPAGPAEKASGLSISEYLDSLRSYRQIERSYQDEPGPAQPQAPAALQRQTAPEALQRQQAPGAPRPGTPEPPRQTLGPQAAAIPQPGPLSTGTTPTTTGTVPGNIQGIQNAAEKPYSGVHPLKWPGEDGIVEGDKWNISQAPNPAASQTDTPKTPETGALTPDEDGIVDFLSGTDYGNTGSQDSTGYLDKPEYGGILNIGAGTRPMEGAYNIDINPTTEGVYFGDVNDLSSIPSGSQSKIVMQNPYKYNPLSFQISRVLQIGGTIEATGNLSSHSFGKIFNISPVQLELRGYEIVSIEPISPEDKGYKSTGDRVNGKIFKIILRKIGDGTYQASN